MQNNIPTLYILKIDSFAVESAKISTILCLFVQKIKTVDRIAMVLFRILHVETTFGNEDEEFLHACISSQDLINSNGCPRSPCCQVSS